MKYKYSKTTSSSPAFNIFSQTTAFFTPLLAPSSKSLYAYHAGKFVSAEEIERKGLSCQITYFFGVRNKVCPLIERLRAVGVEITEYTYIQDCVDAGRLVDRTKYLFEPKSSTSKVNSKRNSLTYPTSIHPSTYIPSNLSVISYPPSSASDSDSDSNYSREIQLTQIHIRAIRHGKEVEEEEKYERFEDDSSCGENKLEIITSSDSSSSEVSPQSKNASHRKDEDRSASSSLSPTNQIEPPRKRKRTRSIALEVVEESELIDEGTSSSIDHEVVEIIVKEEEKESQPPFISPSFEPLTFSFYESMLHKSHTNDPTTIPISKFLEAVTNLLRSDGNMGEMTREEKSRLLRSGLKGIDTGGGGFTGKRIKKGD